MIGPLVHDLLARSAERRPESVFVVDGARRATYGEVEERSGRVASVLIDAGVARGDRVGLIADNSLEYVEAYFGILKAGGVVVSLSTALDSASHASLLRDCGAAGLVCGPRQARVAEALAGMPELRFVLGTASVPGLMAWAAIDAAPSLSKPLTIADTDRAAIVYTSGSTGKPRGVVLRHANIVANTRSIAEYLGLREDDGVFVILPFHYVYGMSLLNTHAAVGGRLIIENGFLYPQKALDRLEREEATGLSGVPSTFAILLTKSNLASRPLPSLRYVTQAGGPMAPDLTRRLVQALPGKRIFIMYGATEASARLSYLAPSELPRRAGSIGKAIPGVELRVLRDDGTETDPGETGELVARGPNIMEGYWNDPEETATVLDADGYHTGDLGTRDEDGFLYVVGRKREMIKSGAHRISPKEIEEILVAHPAVAEAAVIGRPDEILGEAIVAFVTLRRGESDVEPEPILDWCRKRLPSFKVPERVQVLEELPRNASGKTDKLALRGLA
jgi:acyl-CoA synthetase (AMP-forming)/AMP-acid ligase II